ncbi:hypothetical protein TNCT_623851 [Trichonephila clavata]|uniref:Uncharacterized protein n=1 Tax=Trichonephila clavata TaxID=2740835 RepID=A0A8X6EWF5_TRICU|nr:hypothetical protein TNCT_623851 [Trichonephila clavata]
MINVVVTRSASKEIGTNLHTANGSPIENADQIPPPEVHEEEMSEIPQFDRMKEVWLASVASFRLPVRAREVPGSPSVVGKSQIRCRRGVSNNERKIS